MIIKTAQYFIKLYFMNARVWRGSTYVTAAATASVACIEGNGYNWDENNIRSAIKENQMRNYY